MTALVARAPLVLAHNYMPPVATGRGALVCCGRLSAGPCCFACAGRADRRASLVVPGPPIRRPRRTAEWYTAPAPPTCCAQSRYIAGPAAEYRGAPVLPVLAQERGLCSCPRSSQFSQGGAAACGPSFSQPQHGVWRARLFAQQVRPTGCTGRLYVGVAVSTWGCGLCARGVSLPVACQYVLDVEAGNA